MVAIVGRLIAAAAGALVGAAVAKELDKPSDQRGWHGEVAGIPYDFRRPSADKLRRSAWDPDNPEVFVPHAFGVGWSVNLARVAELIQPPQQTVPATNAAAPPELAGPAPRPELPPAAGTAVPVTPATTAAPEPPIAAAAAAAVATATPDALVPPAPEPSAATVASEVPLAPAVATPEPPTPPESVDAATGNTRSAALAEPTATTAPETASGAHKAEPAADDPAAPA
jgi:hypothetical protein